VSHATYRMDRAFGLRMLGRLACVGAVLVVVSGIGLAASGDGSLRVLWYLIGGTGVAVAALGVLLASRPLLVVHLDDNGYRLGRLSGRGVRSAGWKDVDDVHAHDDVDSRRAGSMLISLKSGKTSQVPLSLVPRRAEALQSEISDRLNQAHGYRRWTPSDASDSSGEMSADRSSEDRDR
jgi:hypothetical protein